MRMRMGVKRNGCLVARYALDRHSVPLGLYFGEKSRQYIEIS